MNAEQPRVAAVPTPPSPRRAVTVAVAAALVGLTTLACVLTGAWKVLAPSHRNGATSASTSLVAADREVAAAAASADAVPPPAVDAASSPVGAAAAVPAASAAPAGSAPATLGAATGTPAAVATAASLSAGTRPAGASSPGTGSSPSAARAATDDGAPLAASSQASSGQADAGQADAGQADADPASADSADAAPAGGVVDGSHILASWESSFYPLYETAMRTFGVNWLLIASIHKQETAFSTAPSTYHGLNSYGCCGGPMQFNVTNGPVTTWQLVSGAYRAAPRPAHYAHETAQHPSIYDDFDSIMAATSLLGSDGGGMSLDGSAWQAAYDYYGHDVDGVSYADEVLARAIGWSQHGFCINCSVDPALVAAVHDAYGLSALAALAAPPPTLAPPKHRQAVKPNPVESQPRAVIASVGPGRHGPT